MDQTLLQSLIYKLGMAFSMKDLGFLHFFLGVEVIPFDGGIFLSQSRYAADILKKAKMADCKSINTLMAKRHGLHSSKG